VYIIAVDSRGANVLSAGEVWRSDRDAVIKRTASEKGRQRIRQRIARIDIVSATLRRNVDRGISCSSAELILTIGADSEIRCVTVNSTLSAELHRVLSGGVLDIALELEQVAVGLHHCSSSRIEGFEQVVAKLERRIGVIRRRESGRRPLNVQRSFEVESR